jgi:hypothetical protein
MIQLLMMPLKYNRIGPGEWGDASGQMSRKVELHVVLNYCQLILKL